MSCDCHITELVSSCMSKLSQINRVSKCFDKETISLLVSALLVMNKLLYCSSTWSNTSARNINKLQLVQNIACRIVTNSTKFDHISPKLRELNWLPVKEHLLFRDTVLMYKCINNLAPPYLCNKFSKRSNVHERTRAPSSKYRCIIPPLAREHFIIEGRNYGMIWTITRNKCHL